MTTSLFYYPMTLHRDTAHGPTIATWTNQLPLVSEVTESVYVLTVDDPLQQGAYVWDGKRFRYVLPYLEMCMAIIGGAQIDIYYDLTSSALTIPVSAQVWRNGLPYQGTTFTLNDRAVWGVVVYPQSAAGSVKSVNKQNPDAFGNVTITAANTTGSGEGVVAQDGSQTGVMKFKTIDAGSGLSVSSTADTITLKNTGVLKVSGQSPNAAGEVVVSGKDANPASGESLVVDSGATTGTITFKTLVAGSNITIAADANGNLRIDGSSSYVLPPATYTSLGGVKVGSNISVAADGTISVAPPYALPTASDTTLGGIKIGSGLTITSDGTVSVSSYILPIASSTQLGGIKVGNGLSIDATGVLSATPYTLPIASASALGGVRIGNGLSIDSSGILSVTAVGGVSSVSGQTGAVVVRTTDNNTASGETLIVDNGSTTANAKLRRLVAGTNVTLATDGNGNLVINSSGASGAVTKVSNEGTGIGLVDSDGTAGGEATIKSLNPGSNVTITASADGKTLTIAANQAITPATTSAIGGVIVPTGSGLTVDSVGRLALVPPTGVAIGGVKAGSGVNIATDGTISVTAVGGVSSVSGQTGAVVVQATNFNPASGTSLIRDSGATNANIKLKTIVAGTNITLADDVNGNLQISATSSAAGVTSITAGQSGPLVGPVTFDAGNAIFLSNIGNTIRIDGTGVAEAPNDGNLYGRKNMAWSLIPDVGSAITSITGQSGVGATSLVEDNPPANSAIIKSLIPGNNIQFAEASGLITISASIPSGTVASVNNKLPDASGNVTLQADDVNAVRRDGDTMSGSLNLGMHSLTGVLDPVAPSDAMTLNYMQNLAIDHGTF